jgi:adenylate cyclase 8
MDSTGENWKIQVPEQTATLLREKGYTCVPRGEINVKGKGIMFTYWVLGKNESISRLTSPTICPAGIPSTTTPTSLQRQTSNHSSLAAVVYGIMQATKRNTPSTRKLKILLRYFIFFSRFHRDNQQFFVFNQSTKCFSFR